MKPAMAPLVIFSAISGMLSASALMSPPLRPVVESDADVGGSKRDPSVLVIVFSRRNGTFQRSLVRDMWMRASESTGTKVRFGICHAKDNLKYSLAAEQSMHGDLTFLNCPEGYSEGRLTAKAIAAMKLFVHGHKSRDFFMKVDDDTFVSWSRLFPFLKANGTDLSYIGVPIGHSVPCRNPSYRWYEPIETFNETAFPPAMAGGSGYILGRRLAERILHQKIEQQHLLYNEDRAVGVWVDEARKTGSAATFTSIPGIDGAWSWDAEDPSGNWATWQQYPFMVHHGLLGDTIACLAVVEWRKDPTHRLSHCFDREAGRKLEKPICHTQPHTPSPPPSLLQVEAVPVGTRPHSALRTRPTSLELMKPGEGAQVIPGGNAVDWKTNQQTLIFIHIPKNSGTAIEQAGHAAGVWWPRKWLSFWHGVKMPDGSDCEKYHVPPQYLQAVGDNDHTVFDSETFCVTRHPYDRAVSEYKYMLSVEWGRYMSAQYSTGLYDQPACTKEGLNHFLQQAMEQMHRGKRFLHDCHFVPQHEFIYGKDGKQWCKNVIRNQNLSTDFNHLMERFRYPVRLNPNGEKINNSSGCHGVSRKDLSEKTMRMLDSIYRDDFDLLHYARGHQAVALIHIPRTGGSSIRAAAKQQHAGWSSNDDAFEQRMQMPDSSWCDKRHVPVQFLEKSDARAFRDTENFCVVRHPYDRITSLYLSLAGMHKERRLKMLRSYRIDLAVWGHGCTASGLNLFVKQALSVAESGRPFALDCQLVPQNEYVSDAQGNTKCHTILPYKNMSAAFHALMESKGYPDLTLGSIHMKSTRARANRVCANISARDLDAESRQAMDRYYADDFAQLDFS